jgi:hypothetical protein
MFDGVPIDIVNRRRYKTDLHASGYSLSISGDVQPSVIRRLLETGSEGDDGWASRFLWVITRLQRFVSRGGNIHALQPFLRNLKSALDFACEAGAMSRDEEAEIEWDSLYPQLSMSGDRVLHTDRARTYVLRLSMLYALMNHSAVISKVHLAAALALWKYSYESAHILFGETPQEEAAPVSVLWRRVLEIIRQNSGINRKQLHGKFGRNLKAADLTAALRYLEATGKAYCERYTPQGGGPMGERWYARA